MILKIICFFVWAVWLIFFHADYDASKRLKQLPIYHIGEAVVFGAIVSIVGFFLFQDHFHLTKYTWLLFMYLPLNGLIFSPYFNKRMKNPWNWIGHLTDEPKDHSVIDDFWHWVQTKISGQDADVSNYPLYFNILFFITMGIGEYFIIR